MIFELHIIRSGLTGAFLYRTAFAYNAKKLSICIYNKRWIFFISASGSHCREAAAHAQYSISYMESYAL